MIQRHEIKNKIGEILKEVNQQYEVLKQFDTDVNIEILNAKVAYLANFSDILKKISSIEKIENSVEYSMFEHSKRAGSSSVPKNTFKTVDQISEHQKKAEEEVLEERKSEIPEPFLILKNKENAEKLERLHSPTLESKITLVPEKMTEISQKEAENNTAHDLFTSMQNDAQARLTLLPTNEKSTSINDTFAQQKEPTQMDSLPKIAMPVSDLRLAFGINDRVLFVNELFNGYNLAFTEVLEVLNGKKNFDEAKRYLLDHYYDKNQWVKKEEIVTQFYNILKNKYISL